MPKATAHTGCLPRCDFMCHWLTLLIFMCRWMDCSLERNYMFRLSKWCYGAIILGGTAAGIEFKLLKYWLKKWGRGVSNRFVEKLMKALHHFLGKKAHPYKFYIILVVSQTSGYRFPFETNMPLGYKFMGKSLFELRNVKATYPVMKWWLQLNVLLKCEAHLPIPRNKRPLLTNRPLPNFLR